MGGKQYWEGKALTEVQLRAELSRLTQLLSDRKRMFKDLTISDALFQELQLRPEGELSLHELACLRAQEYAIPIKKDLESTRRDLQETSAHLGDSRATVESLQLELERHRKLSEAALESERLEKIALEERYQRTLRLLEAESALRRQYEDKARKHDEAVEACAKMTVEMQELRATMEQQGKAIAVLTRDEQAARESAGESERARELLALDKTFLQQELRNAEARADEKCRLADNHASKVVSLELKVAQLTDQLMAIRITAQSDADQRMEREMQRLREDYIREVENMKSAARDLADRENRVLREARTQLEGEKEHLQRKCDSLASQLRDKEREAALTLSERTKEIADLRADLKMKSFELSVLGTSFEVRIKHNVCISVRHARYRLYH
jgi:progesterone-induced-blocking factor 1